MIELLDALTLTQPWAGLVAAGIKPLENRTRKIAPRRLFGKRFAIHASKTIDTSVYETIYRLAPELYGHTFTEAPGELSNDALWYKLSRVTGAIIGTAVLKHELCGWSKADILAHRAALEQQFEILIGPGKHWRWMFGPQVYVLADIKPLRDPVPCRGMQGFWTVPDGPARAVRAQLEAA